MSELLPVFYDHSSYKSTLTWWAPDECTPNGPTSIINLCLNNKITNIIGVFTNFHTYIEAYKNCKKYGIKLVPGVEIWITDDVNNKDTVEKNESKVIVLLKNSAAYKDIINIYSDIYCHKSNKYYKFRYDWDRLKAKWTDNLTLMLPFFDSFIHRNTLTFAKIIPKLPTKDIVICREIDPAIPFAPLIDKAIDQFNSDKQYKEVNTKTIFYKDSQPLSIKSWQIFRCIENRTEFSNPELKWCCSTNFSFQNYLELHKQC